jgi:serine/threonine-protein phosphatase 4 regulatory subunit 1
MANPAVDEGGLPTPESDSALRFEDLTIDDDLPLLERVVRYCRSGIALQRLVHVKMLAETAETVGYVRLYA